MNGYSEELWRLVRTRERFVDLPSLGFPTDDEISWRTQSLRPSQFRER